MIYCIVDADGVIENIIVADEAFAEEIGALPYYEGAEIGTAYAPPGLTPAEKREEAYNTEAIIEYAGEMLTVTEAAQLWQYYAAEGNAKADQLTVLIAAAKATIREKYPD